ncbi:hypothetical protein AVEN_188009-1 [Araneus ventricosus]|uniref:RAWUL domain-containing protein n=1 Tax=Araneus ventricosus TaxID=182803 RepID=A0A4Y2HQ64_ARAVE|nr:hypothetical protein AVEN_188009-1 [Araneus ventricosus]
MAGPTLKKVDCLSFTLESVPSLKDEDDMPSVAVELMYGEHLLIDDYTLMDIAYIYSWRRAGPMKFLYTFSHLKYLPKRVLEPIEQTDAEAPPQHDVDSEAAVVPNVSEDGDSKPTAEDSAMDESDESNKPVAETNVTEESNNSNSSVTAVAKTVDESNADGNTPVAVTNNVDEIDSNKNDQPVAPPAEPEKMEAEEATSDSTCVAIPNGTTWTPTLKLEPAYTPQNAVFPPTNGIKLKLVPLPDTSPKARSKKSAGRKGGRTRYKSTPVHRFPRLAPYPPKPATTAATCLSTPNLPQITMGKLVPSVITTLPPNIVTALVSTTANSMCDVTKNSTMLPTATFLSQPPLCTHSNTFAAVPNFIPSSSSAVNTILPNVSGAGVTVKPILAQAVVGSAVSPSETPTLPTTTVQLSVAESKTVTSQPTNALSSATIVSSVRAPTTTSSPEINVSKEQPPVSVPITVQPSMPIISIAPSQPTPMEVSTVDKEQESSSSILKTALSEDQPRDSKTPSPKTIPSATEVKIECNGIKDSASLTPVKESLFCDALSPEKKAFEMSVKNSISAEFSDNDDLGCQPDLVVDEQKMDSSDNEDDTDTALRKKITAIAEKDDEADATDDTEADSGRASDISSQARSSCDDDIGSPMNTMPVSETVTSTVSSRLPTFTLAVSSAPTSSTDNSHTNSRSVKSNKIDSVINNLYLKNEKKDTHGALDLSTCTKKPGEAAAARPKPVANPVLDIKHRQQTYLPAPNANSKQHTACVPSPKHPTSSPILMQGLTAHRHTLLPSQMPGVNRKSPHLPVPTFHTSRMMYPSQTRGMSSPSCMPGRSTPTTPPSLLSHHNSPSPHASHTLSPPVPTAHQGMPAMLTGILPCMSKSVMGAFPLRSATTPAPSARSSSNSTPSNHLAEGKSFFSKGLSRSLSNPSKSMVPSTNSTTPYMTASSHKSNNNSTISSYKRSNSYKSYNGKYAVINPDPNGYQNKMLIRNLDARPNNNSQQSHKL